jgi:hypothetical protein
LSKSQYGVHYSDATPHGSGIANNNTTLPMITFLRWLGILVCAVLMLGFGICGAWGVLGGAMTMNGEMLVMTGLPGVIGLAIAYVCYRVIRNMLKSGDADAAANTAERGD